MGNRIYLRPFSEDDVTDDFLSWFVTGDGHLKYFSRVGDAFDVQPLVDLYVGSIARDDLAIQMIVCGETDNPIGTVKIGVIDQSNLTSDLVCMIGDRSYLGKGLASDAIRLGNQVAFNQLGIRRLHGGMYASNQSSINAYLKAGWYIEATMKNYYLVDGEPMDRVSVACLPEEQK